MLIVIEGIDGAGKTILAHTLGEQLGGEVYSLPSKYTAAGRAFRESAKAKASLTPEMWAGLAAASYNELLGEFLRGGVVICDRYVQSDYAYRHAQGWEFEQTRAFHRENYRYILRPDVSILLDCPIGTALRRLDAREPERTVFENEDFLARAAEGYAKARQVGLFDTVIDATLPPDDVVLAARTAVTRWKTVWSQ